MLNGGMIMYYTIHYDRFMDIMDEKYDASDETIEATWKKIVDAGLGKFVDDEYYIFTKNEVLKIDNYIIDDLDELSVWVGYRVCEAESVEIFEEWRLQYDEIMDKLLEMLDEDVHGDGVTYADSIYNAEDPKEKVYDLLIEITKMVFEQKLDEMKSAMNDFIETLERREFNWD